MCKGGLLREDLEVLVSSLNDKNVAGLFCMDANKRMNEKREGVIKKTKQSCAELAWILGKYQNLNDDLKMEVKMLVEKEKKFQEKLYFKERVLSDCTKELKKSEKKKKGFFGNLFN